MRLAPDWSAPLVIRLLGLRGRWQLALDRTQWKVGAKDVNILMLAVITPRFRVFGEAGLSYSRSTIDGIPINDITQSSFGLGSGVGVVILF